MSVERISPSIAYALHSVATTRALEQQAAGALPPHTLMQRAGLATAQLAQAIAPHARRVWIACGPGNNGGDGLEAAFHLQQRGYQTVVTWLGQSGSVPADAQTSFERAKQAGVVFADQPPAQCDLCIDALLGIGSTRALAGQMFDWVQHINQSSARVLAVDVPTGLQADTGLASSCCVQAHHTLALLSLKPGLFTAGGRDACGQVWLDRLDVDSTHIAADALLPGAPKSLQQPRLHASHKGTHGDVAVVGGAPGMVGAALLAASSALHAGAGRVMVSLLDANAIAVDWLQPELMLRSLDQLDLDTVTVVCGCGGGSAIAATLARVLQQASCLVLDADALNAIAADGQLKTLLRQRPRNFQTVLTPHPLEAARLLDCSTAQVQDHRLLAAQNLANDLGCTVVLKGSGTVTAAPGHTPLINPSGNGLLATGGTGDVLAGLVGARLAGGMTAHEAAWTAVYQHGCVADHWPCNQALTAGALARAMSSAMASSLS